MGRENGRRVNYDQFPRSKAFHQYVEEVRKEYSELLSHAEERLACQAYEHGRIASYLLSHTAKSVITATDIITSLVHYDTQENEALIATIQEWVIACQANPDIHYNRAELEQLRHTGEDAKKLLIARNQRLVIGIARSKLPESEVPDGVQEGILGLMKAINRFNWRRGLRLSTYAMKWIRQAIDRGDDNQGHTIRVAVNQAERRRKIQKRYSLLEQDLGRAPTDEELATACEITLEQLEESRSYIYSHLSLEQPSPGDSRPLEEKTAQQSANGDDEHTIYEIVDINLVREAAMKVLNPVMEHALTKNQCTALKMRMGFPPWHEEQTYQAIGAQVQKTSEQGRLYVKQALAILQRQLTTRQLQLLRSCWQELE